MNPTCIPMQNLEDGDGEGISHPMDICTLMKLIEFEELFKNRD